MRRLLFYRGVLPGRAWWNGEELVKCEDAWFAAAPAFLAFVEDWAVGVVDAWWVCRVFKYFAAAFVDAFLGHVGVGI